MDDHQEALFDAYIDQVLPPGERAEFEAALSTDEALRAALELHRSTRELIELAGLKATLDRIRQSAAEAPADAGAGDRKQVARPFYTARIWQAAAAVLLIGAGIAAWRGLQGSGTSQLYSKYYMPDAGLPGMMGSSTSYTLDDAMVDYKSGQYQDAAQKLEGMRRQGIAGDTTVYYLGMSYLGDKQYETALATLSPLARKESRFREKAAWYAALAELRLGRKTAARAALKAIAATPGHAKAAMARKLLAEWPDNPAPAAQDPGNNK